MTTVFIIWAILFLIIIGLLGYIAIKVTRDQRPEFFCKDCGQEVPEYYFNKKDSRCLVCQRNHNRAAGK